MKEFKFIASSDIHIKNKRPEKRIDDFVATQKKKIAWLFKTAREHGAYILSGGDIFDTPTISYKLVSEYIKLAHKYEAKLLCVFGQHDLRYHAYSSYENTPLSVLLAALQTQHVDEQPFINDLVCVQGASWEREYPFPIQGKVNILLTHRLVTQNGGLWPGHTSYFDAREMLLNTKFDIVVSGDNHQSFALENNGAHLFNTGSLMRLSSDQTQHTPKVPLVTVTKDNITYEWLKVPIEPASKVFVAGIEEQKIQNKEAANRVDNFIASLSGYIIDKPDFLKNLDVVKQDLDASTCHMIDRIVSKVADKNLKVSDSVIDIVKAKG